MYMCMWEQKTYHHIQHAIKRSKQLLEPHPLHSSNQRERETSVWEYKRKNAQDNRRHDTETNVFGASHDVWGYNI